METISPPLRNGFAVFAKLFPSFCETVSGNVTRGLEGWRRGGWHHPPL